MFFKIATKITCYFFLSAIGIFEFNSVQTKKKSTSEMIKSSWWLFEIIFSFMGFSMSLLMQFFCNLFPIWFLSQPISAVCWWLISIDTILMHLCIFALNNGLLWYLSHFKSVNLNIQFNRSIQFKRKMNIRNVNYRGEFRDNQWTNQSNMIEHESYQNTRSNRFFIGRSFIDGTNGTSTEIV